MVMRADIVSTALAWRGTPYRHQASLKGVGCDCLGLLRGVWRETIGPEPEAPPPYSPDWAEAGRAETLAAAGFRHLVPVAIGAQAPGDVLLFRWRPTLPAKHVAILIAPARFLHAYDAAGQVVESSLSPWWRRRLAYAFAFPGARDPE
ncbi:NlpC/P60 family protein [Amorphus sp. 3PC139-8]|uniref:NlpC/P60 family protein n=1 Tax=Amorphus sp. 3PC139-8 TaxID=2735676 RepID=UPI00345DC446